METHTVATYYANIYCSLSPGYGGMARPFCIEDAIELARKYCDKFKVGCTVTPTTFVYPGGEEMGFIVGMVNYPRFPSTPEQIRDHATNLAMILKEQLGQERVSIVCPDMTVLLGHK